MIELLHRFEFEMGLNNYCESTISSYMNVVKLFLEHFGENFTSISEYDIKIYLKQSSSQSLLKQKIGGIKLFYKLVLNDELTFEHIYYPRREEHIPEILSQDEIQRLFDVCSNLKHKTMLLIFYSTGMRISEIINLKISDIDSSRMLFRIEQAKGKKDRQVKLTKQVLNILRKYYKQYRPKEYMFNGQFSLKYSASSIRNFLKHYAKLAGIEKRIYPHLLRHTTGTHMLENGEDIAKIQYMFGHKRESTTKRYAQFSTKVIQTITTPDEYLIFA